MSFFSIIVPVYNVKEYLYDCIESVLSQSFDDFELILVDDGSNDGSETICDNYKDLYEKVKVIHKENGGASTARNEGLKKASGEYCVFLDSDDFWNDSNALQDISNNINSYNSDIIIFGCTDFNMNTGEKTVSRNDYDLGFINSNSNDIVLHYLLSNKLIPGGPTVFSFKNKIAADNNIKFKTGIQDEDYDFVLSIFLHSHSISAINNPFYMYRKGRSDSVTGTSSIKMIYGIEYTVNKWTEISNNIENPLLKNDILNYVAFIYSTGFVICGRMALVERRQALSIMKKYYKVLKNSYWKKPKLTFYLIKLFGFNAFSVAAAWYFDKTHIF